MSDVLDFLSNGKLPPKALGLEVLGELGLEDLEKFKTPVKPTKVVRLLDRIKSIHHLQARLIAQGKNDTQVSSILGVSASTLGSLRQDPTFMELVGYYQTQYADVALENYQKAELIKRLAMDILQERLELEPQNFTNNQVMKLMTELMDRTDMPVKNPQVGGGGVTAITFNFANPLKDKVIEHES